MIQITNLSVSFGAVRALRDVSFSAPTGEVTAVLGANGAGKTTLLRSISGLIRPTSGSILFDERELVGMKTEDIARLGIAHVPEGRGVIAEFTVEENLRLGALNAKVDIQKEIAVQYERFPILGERRKQYAATLSGGERQMLAIARAMVARPRVLLLDEPSLGLAPKVSSETMSTIRDLCESEKITVILVEQNARSALAIADHAAVLHVGTTVAMRPAAEVAEDKELRRYYLGIASE